MKINWKVRFRNPVWVTSLVALIISTIYQALAMFEVAPAITEDTVMQVVSAVMQLLTLMGVTVDPTTKGMGDSERALEFKEPN